MRLWHKDMLEYLPREQLVAQWRELSAIAGNLNTKGTPNHILVNKILNYSMNHFVSYAYYVRTEMTRRGYRTMNSVWNKIIMVTNGDYNILPKEELFPGWHEFEYLRQCYYNLEEKFDCGGIDPEVFNKIALLYAEAYIKNQGD